MVKSELLQKLCDHHPQLLRKDVRKILEVIFFEMSESLFQGNNVEIRGFGTYKLVKRKQRIGRNPKNSESVQICEKNVIRWKMSKVFFNRLNKNFNDKKISDTY